MSERLLDGTLSGKATVLELQIRWGTEDNS